MRHLATMSQSAIWSPGELSWSVQAVSLLQFLPRTAAKRPLLCTNALFGYLELPRISYTATAQEAVGILDTRMIPPYTVNCCEISFTNNDHFCCPLVSKFGTEHRLAVCKMSLTAPILWKVIAKYRRAMCKMSCAIFSTMTLYINELCPKESSWY